MASLFSGNKPENHREQLVETAAFLRNERELSKGQPVGCVGFCMGGGLSAILAGSDSQLKGAVIFYGRPPENELIERIGCPVLGFYGETDAGITPKIPELAAKMSSAGKSFEHHVFTGAGHAFFNDTRSSYQPDAARQSFARVLSFLQERLGGDTTL